MFIVNMNMLDEVLLVNDLVDYTTRFNKDLFVFKVDLEKAFNSVSWDYLLYLFRRMNFGPNGFVRFIITLEITSFLF